MQLILCLKLLLLLSFLLDEVDVSAWHALIVVVDFSFLLIMLAQAFEGALARVDQDREERIAATIFVLVIGANRSLHIDNLVILRWHVDAATLLGEGSFINRNILCDIGVIFLTCQVEGLRWVLVHHVLFKVTLRELLFLHDGWNEGHSRRIVSKLELFHLRPVPLLLLLDLGHVVASVASLDRLQRS